MGCLGSSLTIIMIAPEVTPGLKFYMHNCQLSDVIYADIENIANIH